MEVLTPDGETKASSGNLQIACLKTRSCLRRIPTLKKQPATVPNPPRSSGFPGSPGPDVVNPGGVPGAVAGLNQR